MICRYYFIWILVLLRSSRVKGGCIEKVGWMRMCAIVWRGKSTKLTVQCASSRPPTRPPTRYSSDLDLINYFTRRIDASCKSSSLGVIEKINQGVRMQPYEYLHRYISTAVKFSLNGIHRLRKIAKIVQNYSV